MTDIEEIARLLTSMDSLAHGDHKTAGKVLQEARVISKTSFTDRSDYYDKLEKLKFPLTKIGIKDDLKTILRWMAAAQSLRGILHSMRYDLALQKSAELQPPPKVTPAWLWRHLPWHWWLAGATLLLGALGVGIRLGRNDSLMKAIELFTKHPTK